MPSADPSDVLAAVAGRLAAQVAAYADRVAVDRAPQGTGAWDPQDGPYAVVTQTGPVAPALTGDGAPVTEGVRVAVAVWQAPGDTSDVVPASVAALEGWSPPGTGLRPAFIGSYRVPVPDGDLLRTEIEVRYPHQR